jgi:type I restriction enzyme, S subunit
LNRRIIKVEDVCKLNAVSIRTLDPLPQIQYLDTSNITRNKIDKIQLLDGGKNTIPSRAKRKVKHETIIYSTVRPDQEHHGFLEHPADNLIVSTGFTTLDVIDNSINPKFLYYSLTRKKITDYLQTIATNNVSSYPSINPSDLGNIELEIPSDIETQTCIAAVLSALDAKIELNNRINAELEAMAKTLYDYWFVQFDFPFPAAGSGGGSKPYKTSGGKMVWSNELKREVPEGWEVRSLLEIANYDNGLPCQKFRPTGSEFLRVIKIKEMNEGFSSNTELVRPEIPSKAIIEDGDVLFSWSASLEVKIWTGGKGALNQHIFKVTSDKYPRSFYFYQLLNYLQHFKMMAENRKTTMGHITQEHLQQSRIIIPPINIVLSLSKILEPILEKKIINEVENQNLATLRDWLLPMLMNGQVGVGGAD